MNVEANMIAKLKENGMTERDAVRAISAAKEHKLFTDMGMRWFEDVEDNSERTLDAFWWTFKIVALEWIDANYPDSSYRSKFITE